MTCHTLMFKVNIPTHWAPFKSEDTNNAMLHVDMAHENQVSCCQKLHQFYDLLTMFSSRHRAKRHSGIHLCE